MLQFFLLLFLNLIRILPYSKLILNVKTFVTFLHMCLSDQEKKNLKSSAQAYSVMLGNIMAVFLALFLSFIYGHKIFWWILFNLSLWMFWIKCWSMFQKQWIYCCWPSKIIKPHLILMGKRKCQDFSSYKVTGISLQSNITFY